MRRALILQQVQDERADGINLIVSICSFKRDLMLHHLACIMDGNRRWAMRQNLANLLGHKRGIETINTVVDFCLTKKIPYLSLYAYSIENLHNRSEDEQNYLFGKLAQEAAQEIDIFKRKNVRIQF